MGETFADQLAGARSARSLASAAAPAAGGRGIDGSRRVYSLGVCGWPAGGAVARAARPERLLAAADPSSVPGAPAGAQGSSAVLGAAAALRSRGVLFPEPASVVAALARGFGVRQPPLRRSWRFCLTHLGVCRRFFFLVVGRGGCGGRWAEPSWSSPARGGDGGGGSARGRCSFIVQMLMLALAGSCGCSTRLLQLAPLVRGDAAFFGSGGCWRLKTVGCSADLRSLRVSLISPLFVRVCSFSC